MDNLYPSRGSSEYIIKKPVQENSLVGAYEKADILELHDENIMYRSPDNISPYARTNSFAEFLCLKDFKPLKSDQNDR